MNPEISVIVPCYNASRYIGKCVGSLLHSDFKDIEIICFNDCSTDDTLDRLRGLAESDSRIRVIDSPNNVGSHLARLSAVREAAAPYVVFCDADDYVSPRYLSNLRDGLSMADDVDVVIAYEFFTEGLFRLRRNTLADCLKHYAGTVVEVDREITKGFFGWNRLKLSLCGNLYRREQFNDIPDFKVFYQEDVLTNMHIFSKIKKIALVSGCDYHYRAGGFSSVSERYINDFIKVSAIKKQFIDSHYADRHDYYAGISFELKNCIYEWLVRRRLSGDRLTPRELSQVMTSEVVEVLTLARRYAPASFESPDFTALLGRDIEVVEKRIDARITWRRRLSNFFRNFSF